MEFVALDEGEAFARGRPYLSSIVAKDGLSGVDCLSEMVRRCQRISHAHFASTFILAKTSATSLGTKIPQLMIRESRL